MSGDLMGGGVVFGALEKQKEIVATRDAFARISTRIGFRGAVRGRRHQSAEPLA